MKNLFIVMKFTIKEMIRKKSFIISTVFILLLIVGGFSLPKILEGMSDGKNKDKVVISDTKNVFNGNLETLKSTSFEKYEIEIRNEINDYEQLKQEINDEKIHSAILVDAENGNIKLMYLVKNMQWEPFIPEDILKSINSIYSNMQMQKIGLTPEQLASIQPNFEMQVTQTSEEELGEANIFVMMAMSCVLSIAIIFFTAQVSTSITTEKTSKIMETLVTSTSPRTIVLGKTIGIGIVGLIQVILIITTALISANAFLKPEILNTLLDMSKITPTFLIITIVYFILGYFAYALLYALTGSLVTKPEDIQSANTPISFIAMIGFYLGYFSIVIDPTSGLSSFASLFPISSAFCMPSRVMMGLASGWDIALSIVFLLAMVLVIAKVAIKVYSSAILNYGSKLSLKDAFKMYKEK